MRTFASVAEERGYWRARCPVTADDVTAAGVTWAHVQAHAEANPSAYHSHDMSTPGWAERDAEDGGRKMMRLILSTIRMVSTRSKFGDKPMCEHDVLDAYAAALRRIRVAIANIHVSPSETALGSGRVDLTLDRAEDHAAMLSIRNATKATQLIAPFSVAIDGEVALSGRVGSIDAPSVEGNSEGWLSSTWVLYVHEDA